MLLQIFRMGRPEIAAHAQNWDKFPESNTFCTASFSSLTNGIIGKEIIFVPVRAFRLLWLIAAYFFNNF
jgi:hypothetical protein